MDNIIHSSMTGACKLLACIVDRGHGDRLMQLCKKTGAQGGTTLLGRGTGSSTLLQMLGLSDSRKELVLTLVPQDTAKDITNALQHAPWVQKKVRGVLFQIDVLALHKASTAASMARKDMSMNDTASPSHELITVIVNAGYAEDVMAHARRAGATGGTILHGRGTAKEEDSTFFGLTIVPEKDIVLIISKAENAPALLEAVRSAECLQEQGMGIAFCTPVEAFLPLGGKKHD